MRSRSPRLLRLPVMALLAVPLALGLSLVSLPGPGHAAPVSAEDDPGAPAGDPAPAPDAETTPEAPAEPTVEASSEPTLTESEVATDEASDEPVDEADEPVDEADEPVDEADEPVDEADGADAVDEAAEDAGDELVDEPAADEAPELEPQPEVEPSAVASGAVRLTIRGAIGTPSGEVGISVEGSGAAAGAQYSLWVFSQPQLLTSGAADAEGSFAASAQLPSSLAPGDHTVVLETTGTDGETLKSATGITIGADGTLQGVAENVDASQLVVPVLSDNPKAPKYAPIAPLDNPTAVVVTAIAGLTVATVVGFGGGSSHGGGSGGGGSGGGGSGGGGSEGGGVEAEVRRRKSLRGQEDGAGGDGREGFIPTGPARGDNSRLYRAPGLGIIDRLTLASIAVMSPKSPLAARCLGDAAPLRAIFGSVSLILPIAGIILGLVAGLSTGGIAQPAAAGLMIALIAVGIFDAFAGVLAALMFSLVVVVSGGVIDAASVRTLAGVALLIVGPGIIGGSFRDIRRATVRGSAEAWERLTDLVVVPLLGAWVTFNIAEALPGLGGSAFPIADNAGVLAVVVLVGLILKILVEDAAARWFPERMDSITPIEPDEASRSQRVVSALLRAGTFAFISAAFVGNVWQLWVASLLFLVPALCEIIADRFPNSARLWQALPEGVPLVGFMLIVGWAVSAALVTSLGDSPEYAQTMFVILAVPGFLLALLGMIGRDPDEGDTRWYQRPRMTGLYRIGGVAVLIATAYLALNA
ncbi:unannotated protein [freshwater metagenome]|uniref:Unannotated protein n=1 Tax=freshwater metagenome TaxID=449393 RepID=A0A6J7LHQ2_9ZZZZ